MEVKCINCGGIEVVESKSYPGVNACSSCGFLVAKITPKPFNIIVPEDPNEALLCEGCQ